MTPGQIGIMPFLVQFVRENSTMKAKSTANVLKWRRREWKWLLGPMILPIVTGVVVWVIVEGQCPGSFRSIAKYMSGHTQIPRWWYSLLLVVFVFAVAETIRRIWSICFHLTYRAYVRDSFFDLEWRWSWRDSDVSDLKAYCPTCGREVVQKYHFEHECQDATHLVFHCQQCGQLKKDTRDITKRVRREIELKVRNDEWKEVVKSLPRTA